MKIQQSTLYQGQDYGVDETSDIEAVPKGANIYSTVKRLFAENNDLFIITVLFDDTSGCEFKKVEG